MRGRRLPSACEGLRGEVSPGDGWDITKHWLWYSGAVPAALPWHPGLAHVHLQHYKHQGQSGAALHNLPQPPTELLAGLKASPAPLQQPPEETNFWTKVTGSSQLELL